MWHLFLAAKLIKWGGIAIVIALIGLEERRASAHKRVVV
jgi:hypothetical protein